MSAIFDMGPLAPKTPEDLTNVRDVLVKRALLLLVDANSSLPFSDFAHSARWREQYLKLVRDWNGYREGESLIDAMKRWREEA